MRKNLALVGYGKMGKLIDELTAQHGFNVVLRLTGQENIDGSGITADAFSNVDVAVEFSTPDAAPQNLRRLAALKIRTVTGTTGWLSHLAQVTDEFTQAGSTLVWSPNFSVGMAVFNKLVAQAAELFRGETEYGAWAWEIHHDAKKDAPSGTLVHLVNAMKKQGYTRLIDISSSRAGKHPGTHEVGFDSSSDTLTLRHVARSRDGFAHGALKAARWIQDRSIDGPPGVYTFEEVLFGTARKDSWGEQ